MLSVLYAMGELVWELWRYKRVTGLTLGSNLMIVALSLVSYLTQDGFWFKLQPALLELAFACTLIGSFLVKKPLLIFLLEQQGQSVTDSMRSFFGPLTLRMGLFFLFQAGLAAYASSYWSTEFWAFLKSIGLFLMMVIYMGIEIVIYRYREKSKLR